MKQFMRTAVAFSSIGLMVFSLFIAVSLFSPSTSSRTFISYGNGPINLSNAGTLKSQNWGGYAAATGIKPTASVTAVSGSWTVQTVSATSTGTYSSQWIGIGGLFPGDTSLIQTGTESDYVGGAHYSAWYELLPSGPVTLTTVPVNPGDVISASIICTNSCSSTTQNWTITIADVTTETHFSQAFTYSSSQYSAEWIEERPALCFVFVCRLTTLASFGIAQYGLDYTGVGTTNYATIGGVTGQISMFPHASITMVSSSGSTLAMPSTLSRDGTSFTMVRT